MIAALNSPDDVNMKQNAPDWYDRMIKGGLLIVGILNLVRDWASSFSYMFLLVVLLLMGYPLLKPRVVRWKRVQLEKKALDRFAEEFKAWVQQANRFVVGSDVHSIPYYLRALLAKLQPSLGAFGSSVEGIFANTFQHIERRVQKGFGKYAEFDDASEEFSDLMSSLVLVYVDQVTRELNSEQNQGKLTSSDIADIKRRYEALAHFVDDYNGFRSRLATFLKDKRVTLKIRTPYEVIK
jgi:hypothetical protein